MNCKLPHISALDNSRQFLIDFEAIDDSNKILDDIAFDSIIKDLEQDNIKAYQVSGKPWLRDVTKGGEIAIPNIEVLNKIDQKRKDLGLYEDQLSAEILDQEILPPDEQVQYKFRVINALQSSNVREPKLDNLQGFYNDLIKQGIPNQQIDLVKDILSDVKGKVTKEDIIRELLVRYSYSVEIKTAKRTNVSIEQQIEDEDYETRITRKKDPSKLIPTSYYSNLTVPGGTNYTENEIRTTDITPGITGHAQFSTKEGIGWFRSDEKSVEILDKYIPADDILLKEYKEFEYPFSFEEYRQSRLNNISVIPEYTTNSKIRRILEVQSDLFQKGRDVKSPNEIIEQLKKEGKLQIKCD